MYSTPASRRLVCIYMYVYEVDVLCLYLRVAFVINFNSETAYGMRASLNEFCFVRL